MCHLITLGTELLEIFWFQVTRTRMGASSTQNYMISAHDQRVDEALTNMVSLTYQPFLLGYVSFTQCLWAGVKCLD